MLLHKDEFLDIVEPNPQGVVIFEEGELHENSAKSKKMVGKALHNYQTYKEL